jgi:CMP-N,N'-diacetyllegionaminic acid synthase
MNILCTICARKGSKGLKNKNFLKINNKELIFHSIDQALKTKKINDIIISTDANISQKELKERNLYVYFKRNKKLSNSKSGKVEVIRDALIKAEFFFKKRYDIVIDLDVSSPLRNTKDIINAINKFQKDKTNNLISVCKSRKNPYFNMVEFNNKKLKIVKALNKKILRRQDAPIVYEVNASIYIWKRNFLLKTNNIICKNTSVYEMPFKRSIDIDNKEDLELVKYYFK